MVVSPDMKFYVHIGPPKTGTSAIQKWCVENREYLLKQDIYYPEHDIDPNGISSGNLMSIFERNAQGELSFSTERFDKLCGDAESLGVGCILLSSEFFFNEVALLAEVLPNLKFLAYIRFELSLIESGYNQSVKRHGHISVIDISGKKSSITLSRLRKAICDIGHDKFILRAYSENAFSGGSIVSDMLISLGVNVSDNLFQKTNYRVNTSYSFEGLEYKRWFNKFEADFLYSPLDTFLQHQAKSSDLNYSIIAGQDFSNLKKVLFNQLAFFCNNFQVENSEVLLEDAKNLEQKKVRVQRLGIKSFEQLTSEFIGFDDNAGLLIAKFITEKKDKCSNENDVLKFKVLERKIELIKERSHLFDKICAGLKLPLLGLKEVFSRSNTAGNLASPPNKRSRSNKNNITLLSHQVPFVSEALTLGTLKAIYENIEIYCIEKPLGSITLLEDERLTINSKVQAIHGYVKPSRKTKLIYPAASSICWIADPLERLWKQFNWVLDYEVPVPMYQKLLELAEQRKLNNAKLLFVAMLEESSFDEITKIYSRFFSEISPASFDFVGSEMNWRRDIGRLEELISRKLPSHFENSIRIHSTLPKDLQKCAYLLSEEYALLDSYL